MSRRLGRLLAESPQTVADLIADLEKRNGHPSHDVRHMAQIHQQVLKKLADLNLDPADTTAKELYHALLVKFDADSREFDAAYGTSNSSFTDKLELAAKLLKTSGHTPRQWALRPKTARDLMRSHQPKHVMKYLNYRSVESMLKREDLAKVYLLASCLESDSWQKQQNRLVSKLDQTAFELRDTRIAAVDIDIDEPGAIIISDEMAALTICPSDGPTDSTLLSIMLTLIETMEAYSTGELSAKEIFSSDKIIDWWHQADGLLADLDGGQVSLNIHDVAACHSQMSRFEDRLLDKARKSYWAQLVDRYENKEDIEALFDETVINKVRQFKFRAPEPAYEFEYAEDF
jgi:hypothetical protein